MGKRMTTYHTGNPIGSKDPRDLFDNAENLDNAVNTTSDHTWTDRLGNTRKTWLAVEESAPIAAAAADRADSAADRAEAAAELAMQGDKVVYAETLADLQAIAPPDPQTPGVVWNDPSPEYNGYYVWDGSAWERSGVQPAQKSDVDALRMDVFGLSESASAAYQNFRFSPYFGFDDGIRFEILDRNGRQINSKLLIDTARNAGRTVASPYFGFDDDDGYVALDRSGRVISGAGGQPAPQTELYGRMHVAYEHDSSSLYVAWRHSRTMLLRALWTKNGHNSLFNFKSIWYSLSPQVEGATWVQIQTTVTDYIPPIAFESTLEAEILPVASTGGNHAGPNGELTAWMTDIAFYLNDTQLLSGDFEGYADSVTVSWTNDICAWNTVAAQRPAAQQDIRARFTPRNVEVLAKVTALEPIEIWREGGTQMVGLGWEDRYHFWGGIQQGPSTGTTGLASGGTKAQAPNQWACSVYSSVLGFAACWIDRTFGVKNEAIRDEDGICYKNTYKFYNFTVRNEDTHYQMAEGDTYTWRGGYAYAPPDIVSNGLDAAFIFNQAGRRRLAVANSSSSLSGTITLPAEIISTDFETLGGVSSLGTPLTFTQYTAAFYKEAP